MMNKELAKRTESNEDEHVSRVLGSLRQIEAPADFEMRVRSRIAARRSEKKVAGGWLFLRFAIPSAMAVFLVALLAAYYISPETSNLAMIETPANASPDSEHFADVPTGITTNNTEQERSEAADDQSVVQAENIDKSPTRSVVTIDRNTLAVNSRNIRHTSVPVENPAGSIDRMLSVPEKVVSIDEIRAASPTARYSAVEVLKGSGINAEVKGGIWQVISVSNDSTAARQGVNTGDRIESIDGRKPESSPLFAADHKIKAIVIKKEDGSFKVVEFAN